MAALEKEKTAPKGKVAPKEKVAPKGKTTAKEKKKKDSEASGLKICVICVVSYVVIMITGKLIMNHEEVRLFCKVGT